MNSWKILKMKNQLKLISILCRELNTVNSTIKNIDKPFDRMQAWQIHSYGDLNELQLTTTARKPHITNSKEVLVKVKAASLNPIDLMMIRGYAKEVNSFFRNYELEFPLVLGRDFSGIVIDVGQEVDGIKVDDEVYGVIPLHEQGSLAEYVTANSDLVCLKPQHLKFTEAASMMYAGLTAWSSLHLTGSLCLSDVKSLKVLVMGASGGVGTLAAQMLKADGATVVATCNSDAIQLVKTLGINSVYDYTDKDFVVNVAEEGCFDIILDCAKVGHSNLPLEWKYSKYITLNSPLVKNTDTYGLLPGLFASATDLVTTNIPLVFQGKSVRWGFFAPCSKGLKSLHNLIKNQKLQPVIHKTYKFEEIRSAFTEMKSGHLRGKIVIDI